MAVKRIEARYLVTRMPVEGEDHTVIEMCHLDVFTGGDMTMTPIAEDNKIVAIMPNGVSVDDLVLRSLFQEKNSKRRKAA